MLPRVPPMFGQLCVALCVADGAGDGVAALLGDPALDAVVLAPDDDDVAEDECVVAALAIAVLAPNPTPSAPTPIAVPIMILPSLVFNVSASSRSVDGPALRTPAQTADSLQRCSPDRMKPSDYRMKGPRSLDEEGLDSVRRFAVVFAVTALGDGDWFAAADHPGAAGLAVVGVLEVEAAAGVPLRTLVAVGRDAAGVLEHPG